MHFRQIYEIQLCLADVRYYGNSLGAVTFRDNIKLSVKTLQLFQIFAWKKTRRNSCLNFGNLSFAGYAVKIFYIIENIFTRLDCIWEEILGIHDFIAHRRHFDPAK